MSQEAQSSQEKSHDASAQKLERARKKGELVRSQDAQTAVAYLGLAVAMALAGGWGAIYLGETLMVFLSRPGELIELARGPGAEAITGQIFARIGAAIAPLLLLPAALIVVILVAQRAIVLAPEKLLPKISRISPISNAKQKYGLTGLFEFLKSSVKLIAVGTVLSLVVWAEFDKLPGYSRIDARGIPKLLEAQFWNILTGVLIVAIIIAFIDFLWQRKTHLKKMRMTHQEMKDEARQSEGDPHMRAQRRDRAREIANNRMLHDVPKADVVITNPTHFAVALKWSRVDRAVPVCVAKGVDEMAQRIRLKAEQAGVPVHEDPPTARSIHALVEVGHPIEPDHYKAVAAAIVFADQLRARQRERDALGL